jgi:CheY-like chemotaxis protein
MSKDNSALLFTEAGTMSGTHYRVLMVDDNDLVRFLFQEFGGESPLTVDFAATEEEAIEILQKSQDYDFIVIDYYLQITSGIDLARRIDAEWPAQSWPGRIIILSGLPADSPQAIEVRNAGLAFLERPADPIQLPAKLTEAMQSISMA